MADTDWVDDGQGDWVDDGAPEPKHSPVASAVMHGLSGATGGFSDEIAGGVEAAGRALGIEGAGRPIKDMKLAKGGPTLDWETLRDAYYAARDHERNALAEQSRENPTASTIGDITGMVASPLNKVASGMSLAKGGALLGGINGLGSSDAEDLSGMAKDTAMGAGAGLLLGKAADEVSPLVERGLQKVSSGAGDLAERFAARALGAERGTVKKLGIDKVKAAGRQALDEGVLSPFASTDDLIERNAALKTKGGEMMGKAYKAIDDAGVSTFNPLDVASKVDDEIGGFYRSPINRGETNQLENTLESILMRGEGNIPLQKAQALKEELGKVANWRNNQNITDKERMARDAYRVVSDQIDNAVQVGSDAIESAGLSDALKQGKDLYSKASTAEQLLGNKQAREEGNKILGLTDWSLLGGGLGAAVPTGGASIPATMAMTAAKKGLEKYGSQNAALGLNKISKTLSKSPQMAELLSSKPQVFNALAQKMEGAISGGMKAADNKPKPYDKNAIIQKAQGTKYAQVLQNAAQKGDQAFNAAYFVLQSNPEFRASVQQKDDYFE